jgi:hypothetical protein
LNLVGSLCKQKEHFEVFENGKSYPRSIRSSRFIPLDLDENESDEGIGPLIPENEASSKK